MILFWGENNKLKSRLKWSSSTCTNRVKRDRVSDESNQNFEGKSFELSSLCASALKYEVKKFSILKLIEFEYFPFFPFTWQEVFICFGIHCFGDYIQNFESFTFQLGKEGSNESTKCQSLQLPADGECKIERINLESAPK